MENISTNEKEFDSSAVIMASFKGNFEQLEQLREKVGDAALLYLGINSFGKVVIHCNTYKKTIEDFNKKSSAFLPLGAGLVVDFTEAVDEKNIGKNFEKYLSFVDFNKVHEQYPDLLNSVLPIFKEDMYKELFPVLERFVLHALNPNEKKHKIKII